VLYSPAMVRRAALAMLAALAVFSLAAATTEAKSKYFFAKPSRIGCAALKLQRQSATLRCDLPFLGRKAAFLHLRGKGAIKRVSSTRRHRKGAILRKGHTGVFGPFKCVSRKTALSCSVRSGHGFTVGRGFQLVF
jgi:hypothetical protein